MTPADLLNQARAAKRDGTSSQVIEALVLAWQLSREPWLGDLIDRWILAVAPERPPVGSATSTLHQSWLERSAARQSADLSHLFEAIARGTSDKVHERVQSLSEWPPNPFIARVLAGWTLEHPFGKPGRPTLELAFSVLARIKDPRVAAILEQAVSTPVETLDRIGRKNWQALQALAKTSREWAALRQPVSVTEREGLEPAPPARRDHRALFASIHAAPDDLDARQVLADALLEEGDARGEFISIQLERARRGSTRVGAREKELLAQYGVAWLGPLAPLFRSWAFERGFFVGGVLADWNQQTANDGAWQLVEWLDVSRATVSTLNLMAVTPRLRRLNGGDVSGVLAAGAAGPLALVELEGSVDLEAELEALASAGPILPRLEVLSLTPRWRTELRPKDVSKLVASALSRQLRRLAVELSVVETYDQGVAVHDLVSAALATGRGHFEVKTGGVHVDVDVAARHAHVHLDSPAPAPFFLPGLDTVELSGDEAAVHLFRSRVGAKSVTIARARPKAK